MLAVLAAVLLPFVLLGLVLALAALEDGLETGDTGDPVPDLD